MQGGLGIGANLNKWVETDFADAARMVAAYKQIRQTVQRGSLYRLIRPGDASGRVANLYVSGDKRQAVLFAFLHSSTELNALPSIPVTGLDPARRYRVRAIDAAEKPNDEVRSGAYWISHGIDLPMKGDFQAAGRVFEGVD